MSVKLWEIVINNPSDILGLIFPESEKYLIYNFTKKERKQILMFEKVESEKI